MVSERAGVAAAHNDHDSGGPRFSGGGAEVLTGDVQPCLRSSAATGVELAGGRVSWT